MYFMDHQAKERLDVSKADFGPGLEPIWGMILKNLESLFDSWFLGRGSISSRMNKVNESTLQNILERIWHSIVAT